MILSHSSIACTQKGKYYDYIFSQGNTPICKIQFVHQQDFQAPPSFQLPLNIGKLFVRVKSHR